MTAPDFHDNESTSSLETAAKRILYGIVALDVALVFAFYYGYVPAIFAGILYWGSPLAIIWVIRTVEEAVHPEQRGWWTLLPLAIGGFGLLSWLRHLDKEH